MTGLATGSEKSGRALFEVLERTVIEAEVVGELSPDDPLLNEGLHSIRVPPGSLNAHHRRLRAHLPQVEVRRHVRAHVLVGVVGEVREALHSGFDEGLEVIARALRPRLEP